MIWIIYGGAGGWEKWGCSILNDSIRAILREMYIGTTTEKNVSQHGRFCSDT